MKSIFLLVASVYTYCLHAQADTAAMIKEAANKLNSGTSVSTILTDKNYIALHPKTAFRQLIEQHATSGPLKISTNDESGKKIRVIGTVNNKEGKLVAGALIYLYQTDSRGWYAADAPHVLAYEGDMRHARLFGYVKTDVKGQFELHTVKPSGYPRSDLPAHIHIHVSATGYSSYVTELLFDDDDRLIGKIREQAIRSNFIVAKPEKATAPFEQQFSYLLRLN